MGALQKINSKLLPFPQEEYLKKAYVRLGDKYFTHFPLEGFLGKNNSGAPTLIGPQVPPFDIYFEQNQLSEIFSTYIKQNQKSLSQRLLDMLFLLQTIEDSLGTGLVYQKLKIFINNKIYHNFSHYDSLSTFIYSTKLEKYINKLKGDSIPFVLRCFIQNKYTRLHPTHESPDESVVMELSKLIYEHGLDKSYLFELKNNLNITTFGLKGYQSLVFIAQRIL